MEDQQQPFRARAMAGDRAHYLRFMQLPLEWSADSGVPAQMVLRHLCEWTVAGAFPAGALVTALGEEVTPLSIYEAYLSLAKGGQVYLGGWITYLQQDQALDRLNAILVTAENVTQFCENARTLPPRSIMRGLKRTLALLDQNKELSPPPCPQANSIADKLRAKDCARGFLNTMNSTLRGLRGEPVLFGPRRAENEPIDIESWQGRWDRDRKFVEDAIRLCGDGDLEQELQSLDDSWAELVREQAQACPAGVEEQVTAQGGLRLPHRIPTNRRRRIGILSPGHPIGIRPTSPDCAVRGL